MVNRQVDNTPMSLQIRCFGRFTALDQGKTVQFATERSKALLAYLACHLNQPQSREHLAALLWPESQSKQARQSLRMELNRLRSALSKESAAQLIATRQTIELRGDPQAVDMLACDQILTQVMAHDHARLAECEECLTLLEQATDLIQPQILGEIEVYDSDPFEQWRVAAQERMWTRAVTALEMLIQVRLVQARHNPVIQLAQRLLELEPWREETHRALILGFTHTGQRGRALQQYESYRQILAQELQAEPSPVMKAIYHQLRTEANGGAAAPSRAAERTASAPYKGLAPFGQEDAPDFFGRDRAVDSLCKVLNQRLVTILIGASGSGKSSLIHAGLLPKCTQHQIQPILFRPGAAPFEAWAAALAPFCPSMSQEDLLALLRQDPWTPQPLLAALPAPPEGETQSTLLVVDQFEEVFTLCQDEQIRHRFIERLLSLGQHGEGKLRLLIAMRADFTAQGLSYLPLAEAFQESVMVLPPMNREEMTEAVYQPARRQQVFFEPGLVERLLDDIGDDPGKLPLLEFALTLLWEERQEEWITHHAYEEIERVAGALTHYANRIYARLAPEEQPRARRIFTRMVQPGMGTEDTSHPINRAEVSEADWALITHLAGLRLLVTNRNPEGEETAEIIHEALIREWRMLRQWLEEDREYRLWDQRSTLSCRQWHRLEEDPDLLLRGNALIEAERWMQERRAEIGPLKQEFIETSLAVRQQAIQAEEARQRWELAQAQNLANLEARRAAESAASGAQLKRLLILLSVLLVFALGSTLYALDRQRVAVEQSQISAVAQLDAEDARAQAQSEQRRAEINADLALARALEAQATQILDSNVDLAMLLHLEAVGLIQDDLYHNQVLQNFNLSPFLHRVLPNTGWAVHQVAILDPNQQILAVGEQGDMRLLSPDGPGQPFDLGVEAPHRVVLNPRGDRLALIQGSSLTLFSLPERTPILQDEESHTAAIGHIAFSGDGNRLITADREGRMVQWSLADGARLAVQEGLYRGNEYASWDGTLIFITAEDAERKPLVQIYDFASAQAIGPPMTGHRDIIHDMTFSPDGGHVGYGQLRRLHPPVGCPHRAAALREPVGTSGPGADCGLQPGRSLPLQRGDRWPGTLLGDGRPAQRGAVLWGAWQLGARH